MLTLLLIHSRYADHIGIHYVLCSKLRQFAYEEIEFFLPQYDDLGLPSECSGPLAYVV